MEETAAQMKEIEQLFNAGCHLGHKKNRLNPKARKYVYKMVNGVSVIDLTKTVVQLHKARTYVRTLSAEGKLILTVATKKVVSQYVSELAKEKGLPSITVKWMPGLLTNFETLSKNIRKMNTMEKEKADGTWEQYVKHERTKMARELSRLKRLYGGISTLNRKPDALFIVDIKREKNALKEAFQNNIPVIAITDTNSNPDVVAYPIVANDDAPTSAQLLVSEIMNAYVASAPVKAQEQTATEKVKEEAAPVAEPAKKQEESKEKPKKEAVKKPRKKPAKTVKAE